MRTPSNGLLSAKIRPLEPNSVIVAALGGMEGERVELPPASLVIYFFISNG